MEMRGVALRNSSGPAQRFRGNADVALPLPIESFAAELLERPGSRKSLGGRRAMVSVVTGAATAAGDEAPAGIGNLIAGVPGVERVRAVGGGS